MVYSEGPWGWPLGAPGLGSASIHGCHRLLRTGLGLTLGQQDLKDFARKSGLDVVFSEVGRDRDGKG